MDRGRQLVHRVKQSGYLVIKYVLKPFDDALHLKNASQLHPPLYVILLAIVRLIFSNQLVLALAKLLLHSYSRSEEHTSELQSRFDLVCRLLLEENKK